MSEAKNEFPGGLVGALEFDGAGRARELGWDDIAQRSANVRWIHLDFTQQQARDWVRNESGLDTLIAEALLEEDSRPRALRHGDGLLVILRGVNTNPGADPEDMVAIRMWIEADRIISTRRRRLLSVVALREAFRAGLGPKTAGEFLVTMTQFLSERIGPVVDELDETIDAAELEFGENPESVYGGEFSALRRQAARIRRYLAPQRDALDRLSRETETVLSTGECLSIREEADQITRYLEDLDLTRERAILAQEEIMGRLAHEQNQRMYVLSLVAAIFLPLSFLTGMMGMNVAGMPGTEDPAAFMLLSVFMLVIAVGIVALFRWRRWL